MRLFRRTRTTATTGLLGNTLVTAGGGREQLRKTLQHGLQALDRTARAPGASPLQIQLVAQVCAASHYPEWKAGWENAWRKRGESLSTSRWPAGLPADGFMVLLLPLTAGRVGPSVGKHPRLAATPIFTTGSSSGGQSHEDAVLVAVSRWVANPAVGQTARLAPPVIEILRRGAATERAVETFGLTWPLPVADGL